MNKRLFQLKGKTVRICLTFWASGRRFFSNSLMDRQVAKPKKGPFIVRTSFCMLWCGDKIYYIRSLHHISCSCTVLYLPSPLHLLYISFFLAYLNWCFFLNPLKYVCLYLSFEIAYKRIRGLTSLRSRYRSLICPIIPQSTVLFLDILSFIRICTT